VFLRLQNEDIRTYGKVEALVDGKWGPICRTDNTDSDAMAGAVCRTLGHSGQAVELPTFSEATFKEAWMEIRHCSGNEKTIVDCQRTPIERLVCKSNAGISVSCGNSSCKYIFNNEVHDLVHGKKGANRPLKFGSMLPHLRPHDRYL
jgi:hypothetical protein